MRGRTVQDQQLLELLDPVANFAGYDIVRLRLMGADRALRLQILAERADGDMPVDDCARLARALSQVLDDADPIRGDYQLEVSSPGIDRPLTRLADFANYEGFQARIELDMLVDGRKRFKGELAGVDGAEAMIRVDGEAEPVRLPFASISEARLIIDDALLKRGAEARAARLARNDTFNTDTPGTPQ